MVVIGVIQFVIQCTANHGNRNDVSSKTKQKIKKIKKKPKTNAQLVKKNANLEKSIINKVTFIYNSLI